MSTVQNQHDRSIAPDRLQERLESLGLTPVWIAPDGRVSIQGQAPRLQRLLAASSALRAAVRAHWSALCEHPGEALAVWPGLWLVCLRRPRRRDTADDQAATLPGVLMIGAELLASEQFHVVCDAAEVDAQAVVAMVDRTAMVTAGEARRLAITLAWMHEDALQINRRQEELLTMSQQLGDSYEELSLLYKLSSNMSVNQTPAKFLTDACAELQQVAGLRWMALQLSDDPRLNELAHQLYAAGEPGCNHAALSKAGRTLMAMHAQQSDPLIVENTATIDAPALAPIGHNLLAVWLSIDGKLVGVLFGADKLDGDRITSVDSKLCDSLGHSLAIFLENTMLYEDMQAMFMGTLHALTASIDAKDSYTRGHSERVAMLSRQLAIAADLSAHSVERVYISGLVHDVGKIGVPESVLCKPGKLTKEEFDLVKQHPVIGAVILEDIRQMQDLIPGVLYHHERWDGRGYPHKLAGTKIPLFGRLICLADSFDAMSSSRTYRKSLPHDQVMTEIRNCAGTQFDPDLARLFVNIDFDPFFHMLDEHQNEQDNAKVTAHDADA